MATVFPERNNENECYVAHKRNVIRFFLQNETTIDENCTSSLNAVVYTYNSKQEIFEIDRTEKMDINVNSRKKMPPRKLICASVLLDFNTGFKIPFVVLMTSSKKKFALHVFSFDDLLQKPGNQLQIAYEFFIPCDITHETRGFLMSDGPSFSFRGENDVNVICCPKTTSEVFRYSLNLNGFVYTRECGKKLMFSFVCATRGNLVSFYIGDDEPSESSALIPREFLLKMDVQSVNVKVCWRKREESVAYVISNGELHEFQNGKLKKSTVLENGLDFRGIYFYEKFGPRTEYVVILTKSGKVFAVNSTTFEVSKKWENISSVQISDVLGTRNNLLFLKLNSEIKDFEAQLQENFIATNVEKILYPKDGNFEDNSSSSQQKKMAAGILQEKLQVGNKMLEKAQAKIDEKTQFLKHTISRIQSTSATGIVNNISPCPNLIDVIPYSKEANESFLGVVELPLKILELSHKSHKEFWLIQLKIENQAMFPLTDFTLQLIATNKPIDYHVKFIARSNSEDIGLTNLKKKNNYFTASSPTIQPTEKLTVMAAVPLSQSLFECVNVHVHVSVLFHELKKNVTSDTRLQMCGSLNFTVAAKGVVDPPPPSEFDIWAMAATQFEISLTIHSVETNLNHIHQLLCDNLLFQHQNSLDVLFWKTPNHLLSDVWLQITSSTNENEINFDLHYNSESQVILLLHVIYNHLPSDIIITPNTGNVEGLITLLHHNLQKELNIIEEITSAQSNSPPPQMPNDILGVNVEDSLQKIRDAFADRQKWLQESRSNKIDMNIFAPLREKLSKVEQETDLYVGLLGENSIPYFKKSK